MSVLLHIQGNHIILAQVSLSPYSLAIMSCAHSVKQWMVVCQSCMAEIDSRVCHSSWTTAGHAFEGAEPWNELKAECEKNDCQTARVILTLSNIINCDFALRISIILICSTSGLYNTVTQSHHVVNKMGNHEGILPREIFTSVTEGGFVSALF